MKSVTIEELRAHLDEVIAEVRNGETITITQDGARFGTIGPDRLFNPPREPGRFQDVPLGSRPKNLKTDPVALLIEDRQSELKKHGF